MSIDKWREHLRNRDGKAIYKRIQHRSYEILGKPVPTSIELQRLADQAVNRAKESMTDEQISEWAARLAESLATK